MSSCKHCQGPLDSIFEVYGGQSHSCSRCHLPTSVYFCNCHRTQFSQLRSLRNHLRNQQRRQEPNIPSNVGDDGGPGDTEEEEKEEEHGEVIAELLQWWRELPDYDGELHTKPTVEQYLSSGPGASLSPNTKAYIQNETRQKGEGSKRIVVAAFLKMKSHQARHLPTEQLPLEKEVHFHLMLANFLNELTSKQVETMGYLLETIVSQAIAIGEKKPPTPAAMFQSGTTRLPQNHEDLTSIYVGASTSIIKSLPSPMVQQAGNTFAFTSLHEAIQSFLLWRDTYTIPELDLSGEVLPKRYVDLLTAVRQVCPLYKPLVLPLNEWMDKFEGQTTKKNRKSVHATTATFCGSRQKEFTTALSIGSGSQDGRPMEIKLRDSYKDTLFALQWFWDGRIATMHPVVVVPFGVIQDRVERNGTTQSLSHSSSIARRWQYIYTGPLSTLVPCGKCHGNRLMCLSSTSSEYIPPLDCSCADLEFDTSRDSVPLNSDYPTATCSCGTCPKRPTQPAVPYDNSHSSSIFLTFEHLNVCLRWSIHHRKGNVWKAKEAVQFLRLAGINEFTHKQVELQLKNYPTKTEALVFQACQPLSWDRGITFEAFTAAEMHLLKGNGELIFDDLVYFFGSYKKGTEIIHELNPWMLSLNSLQLGWLRVQPFGGKSQDKIGGWVSENYIDFARFHYILIFLAVRNVEFRKQKLVQATGTDAILRLLYLHHCLVSRLLAETADARSKELPSELEEYVKAFLYQLDRVEGGTLRLRQQRRIKRKKGKSLAWENKGNPLSLLNSSHQMQLFGSCRDMTWDGDREHYVHYLKPELGNVRASSQTYFPGKLNNLHRKATAHSMLEKERIRAGIPREPVRPRIYKHFRCYGDESRIGIFRDQSSRVLSGFVIDRSMYVCFREHTRKVCSRIFSIEDSTLYMDGAVKVAKVMMDARSVSLETVLPGGSDAAIGFVLFLCWETNGFKYCTRTNENWKSNAVTFRKPPSQWGTFPDSFQELMEEDLDNNDTIEGEEEEEDDDDAEFEFAVDSVENPLGDFNLLGYDLDALN